MKPTAKKYCSKCYTWQPVDNFYLRTTGQPECWCRPCRKAYQAAIRPTLEVRRYQKIKAKFGLSREAWEDLFMAQWGLCYMCGGPFAGAHPQVDHDHSTGRVRGLAHGACNRAAGAVGDDPKILAKIAKSLEAALSTP